MKNGYSDIASPTKWNRLRLLYGVHAKIVKPFGRKYDWASNDYHYLEPHCGVGIYTEEESHKLAGKKGSAVIAAEILSREFKERLHLVFNDQEQSCVARCKQAVIETINPTPLFGPPTIEPVFRCQDCTDFIDWLIKDYMVGQKLAMFGMIFFDPCGPPKWETVRQFSECRRFSKIDILVNINSTISKLCAVSSAHPTWTQRPTEYLRSLKKKHFLLWEPTPGDNHQFALAVATNWHDFPQFERAGFYNIETLEGMKIAERIDYTHAERAARAKNGDFEDEETP